ncbi:MAG: protein phosphatase [Gemmatimonadetes bacterium]|nr:protein phosphatase [Gemmatimonadota bacterium]MBT4612639.1 protein phosphatase [Gemmatimonadota bacterium]MBT5056028.1 protein phosphatase [Gemmatimonadota bacterium]MBT5143210.1 protein phosphatase [Gemmatimonadota bacterium]MBT5586856.1 protein phosphatase [Gemmatimonadota bacterium]
MPFNFSWIVEGRLAASGLPGGAPYMGVSLKDDLSYFRSQDIGVIVSLTESPLDPAFLEQAGLVGVHLPVPDMTSPSQDTIESFLRVVDEAEDRGYAALVHCRAGLGRTGTLLACYLVRDGLSGDAAIEEVRHKRPGSIETAEQEAMIRDFAVRCANEKQQA